MITTQSSRFVRSGVLISILAFLLLAAGCSPPAEESASSGVATSEPAPAPAVEPAAELAGQDIPVTTSSDTALELFNEGQHLADVGRGVQARSKFQAAIAEDPGFVYAYYGQSNVALSFKEFQQVLDTAQEHLEGASDGEKILIEINRSFLSNDQAHGLKLAQELAQHHPGSARALVALAGMQIAQNDHVGARASLEAVLAMHEDAPAALSGLANSYLFGEPKDFAKAEEWANRFITALPAEAKAFEVMGDIHRAQDNLDGALEAYNKAAETDPTMEVAAHKKGHVNSFLGNIEDARASYDDAISLAPPESKAVYAVYKAFTNIHAENIPGALDELVALADGTEAMGTPADQVKGNQVFALTSASTAALHAGLYERADSLVSRRNELVMAIAEDVGTDDARRLQQSNAELWSGLLAAYQGNAEAAQAHAAKITALVEGDDNPRKMEPVHWVLGMSAMKAGDHAGALEHLRQADHANNIYIRYQLAVAEDANGNAEEALALFGTVARFNFNSVGFALVHKDAKSRLGSD